MKKIFVFIPILLSCVLTTVVGMDGLTTLKKKDSRRNPVTSTSPEAQLIKTILEKYDTCKSSLELGNLKLSEQCISYEQISIAVFNGTLTQKDLVELQTILTTGTPVDLIQFLTEKASSFSIAKNGVPLPEVPENTPQPFTIIQPQTLKAAPVLTSQQPQLQSSTISSTASPATKNTIPHEKFVHYFAIGFFCNLLPNTFTQRVVGNGIGLSASLLLNSKEKDTYNMYSEAKKGGYACGALGGLLTRALLNKTLIPLTAYTFKASMRLFRK